MNLRKLYFWTEGRQEGILEGRQEGILGTVAILRDLNMSDDKIAVSLMKQYNLSKDEAEFFLNVNAP